MRKVYFSWKPRHPVLALCGLLLLFGILWLLFSAVIPKGGVEWKLWGSETYSFDFGNAQIDMRLDTSGYGRYEVECGEEAVSVMRDGAVIMIGSFVLEDYAALEQAVDSEAVIESEPGKSVFYRSVTEEGAEYILLERIDRFPFTIEFWIYNYGDVSEAEALDRIHRLQFIRKD